MSNVRCGLYLFPLAFERGIYVGLRIRGRTPSAMTSVGVKRGFQNVFFQLLEGPFAQSAGFGERARGRQCG